MIGLSLITLFIIKLLLCEGLLPLSCKLPPSVNQRPRLGLCQQQIAELLVQVRTYSMHNLFKY